MKRCPFCNKKLRHYNYSDYYDPPECGEVCNNSKCGKYADKYFYYDGVTFQCGNWIYNEVNSKINIESAELEFKKRIKYQLKNINKIKK